MKTEWHCTRCEENVFAPADARIVMCGRCSVPGAMVEMEQVLSDQDFIERIEAAKACRAELSAEKGNGKICAVFTAAIKDAEEELARRKNAQRLTPGN